MSYSPKEVTEDGGRLNSVGKNFHTIAELQCGCDADVFPSLRYKVSGGNF